MVVAASAAVATRPSANPPSNFRKFFM
jgi:hypothetical protein